MIIGESNNIYHSNKNNKHNEKKNVHWRKLPTHAQQILIILITSNSSDSVASSMF